VPSKEKLSCISRSHFELSWDASTGELRLRRLSGNQLFVGDKVLAAGESVPVTDGVHLAFGGSSDSDPRFLMLRLRMRSQAEVAAEGSHPAVALTLAASAAAAAATAGPGMAMGRQRSGPNSTPQYAMPQTTPASVAGVLECVRVLGTEVKGIPPEARVIALPLDDPIEVGRSHQLGFFESLLQAEPQWLSFISRTHCRVQLLHGSPGAAAGVAAASAPAGSKYWLWVENLSSNPVFVRGRPLAKGKGDSVLDGDTLAFVAVGTTGEETTFLELRLRRARYNSGG